MSVLFTTNPKRSRHKKGRRRPNPRHGRKIHQPNYTGEKLDPGATGLNQMRSLYEVKNAQRVANDNSKTPNPFHASVVPRGG